MLLPVAISLIEAGRPFLIDALDLVATAATLPPERELGHIAVGSSDEPRDSFKAFCQEFMARHALACSQLLRDVVAGIEKRPSLTSQVRDAESRGEIRGRLNIPRYLAMRGHNKSIPRIYPLLVTLEAAETPENALLVWALRGCIERLALTPFPRQTAEGNTSMALASWARGHLRRNPWSTVTSRGRPETLAAASAHRIRKRQTGNEEGYTRLIGWLDEWNIDVSRLGSHACESLVSGLLAFQPSDSFWVTVFELWCIQAIRSALTRAGCSVTTGPVPLYRLGVEPLYRLRGLGRAFELWYRRQVPMGDARWHYMSTGDPFRGIPDIVVKDSTGRLLVGDAKLRSVSTDTRPDETYKMLGYAENFGTPPGGFFGFLVFPGEARRLASLQGPDGGLLTLLTVAGGPPARAQCDALFDEVVASWLTGESSAGSSSDRR